VLLNVLGSIWGKIGVRNVRLPREMVNYIQSTVEDIFLKMHMAPATVRAEGLGGGQRITVDWTLRNKSGHDYPMGMTVETVEPIPTAEELALLGKELKDVRL